MRRLLPLIAALLLGLSAPASVQAGTQSSCAMADTTKFLLHENRIGDTSDGDDRLWRCGSWADLSTVSHDLAGHCKGWADITGSYTHWGPDCVSSFSTWIPSGWVAEAFVGANYAIRHTCVIGPSNGGRTNMAANDSTNSVRLRSGSC